MKNFLYSSKIKNWLKVSNPSIPILIGQFFFALLPNILLILSALPSAKIITSLTIFDYTAATFYVILDFVLIVLSNISSFINKIFHSLQIKYIYKNAQEKIYNKLILMTDDSLKINSKEKLISVMSSSLHDLADYSNKFIHQIAEYITAIITLIIVTIYSFTVGLIIFTISIFVYLMFKIVNNKISKNSLTLQLKKDETCEIFADIVDGRDEIFDLNTQPGLKNKYIEKNLEIASLYKKQNNLDSIKYNWLKILWKGFVFLITLYFITQLKYNYLSLTSYLIIIPYLSDTINKFIDAYDNYYNLEMANISALRIKTIYDIPEKDIIFFGNNITDNISGGINFSNISLSKDSHSLLNSFSLQIKKRDFVVFKGDRDCGKNHIFDLLKRDCVPTTGTITIDSINIFDFDAEFYKKNISYTTPTPFFFDMSILDNLKLIEKNKKEIDNGIKLFNLQPFFESLPNNLNTNLNRIEYKPSSYDLYLLGLLRCYLTKSEIIMLYEIPFDITSEETKHLIKILTKINKSKTLLIFTAQNLFDNIATKLIEIKNGELVYKKGIKTQTNINK